MTNKLSIELNIHFAREGRGARREARRGMAPVLESVPTGRVPRVSRLMALAIRFEQLLRNGQAADYADLARLSHVTRARITQIMNLRLLAPDIQEAVLFLPAISTGKDTLLLRDLQPIALTAAWGKQRQLLRKLTSAFPIS